MHSCTQREVKMNEISKHARKLQYLHECLRFCVDKTERKNLEVLIAISQQKLSVALSNRNIMRVTA